jgi:eukaryotic-like serine/threonine-protein kinase
MNNSSIPSRQEREAALFALAAEKPSAERAAFLQAICGKDGVLRQRLEALLAAHEQPADLLPEEAAPTMKIDFAEEPADEAVGQTLGRYKLLERIGEGGCGVVYVAEQTEPVRRRVALKVIKLGMDTKQVVARFEAERQALAMMDHPNIAKVLDAGTTDVGRPYFVMELVRGIRITDYCDQAQLSTKGRLDLFIKVCQAIQHAHQKGIIHRDIKPSNILVTLHDGVPVPKVIDFGIAKATEGRLTNATVYTQLHQFIGTPAYMSPEQAEMSGLDIDTRSDIYSLGVLLYELLAGSTPFDGTELMASGLDAMRRTIREKEPVRPSTRLATLKGEDLTTTAKRRSADTAKLLHQLKGDLDWIVMKCLEKDRTRRYETANDLAADLKRHLRHEPVAARPPSAAYKLQKALRRNKLAVGAAAAVATALVIGLAASAWQAVRATRAEHAQRQLRRQAETARASEAEQRQQAEAARANETRLRKRAQLEGYAGDMKAAQVALAQNSRGQAVQLLDRYWPRDGEDDLRGVEWRYLWQQARGDEAYVFQHPNIVVGARFSPDGRLLVTACFDGFLRVWDLASRKLVARLDRGVRDDLYLGSFAFSPDGLTLASADRNGFVLWETIDWSVGRRLDHDPTPVPERFRNGSTSVAYSRDGRFLAAASPWAAIRIWDTQNWQFRTLTNAIRPRTIAFMPDNKTLLVSDGHRLWSSDLTAEKPVLVGQSEPGRGLQSLALTKDGAQLAVTSWNGELQLRDCHSLQIIRSNRIHRSAFHAVAYSPDDKTLATGGFDQAVHLIDAITGEVRETLRGHLNEVWSVDFSPDGRWLVSSGKDGTARLWDLRHARQSHQTWLGGKSLFVGFGPDGRQTIILTNKTIQYRDLTNVVRSFELDANSVGAPRATEGGRRFFVSTRDTSTNSSISRSGVIRTFNEAGIETARFAHTKRLQIVAVSPDHRHLAVRTPHEGDVVMRVIDAASGATVAEFPDVNRSPRETEPFTFSHDGRLVAYGTTNFTIKIWDLARSRSVNELSGHVWYLNAVSFSRDNLRLASASWDGDARIWDVDTGKMAAGPLRGHGSGVGAVTFSPDGKTLLTSGDDNTVRLWHVATGREMLVLPNVAGGDMLSSTGERLVLWDTTRQALCVERISTLEEIAAAEAERKGQSQPP